MEAFKARSAAGYLYLPQPRSFGKGTDCIYVNLQTNKELSCGRVFDSVYVAVCKKELFT